MNLNDIAKLRLANQQLSRSDFRTPGDLVYWMGAIQAQEFNMSKWALGIRLPGSTEKDVEAAFDAGKIIRMHLLRPTWHIVSSEDVHWMLELSASSIRAAMKARDRQLELTEDIFRKSNRLLEKTLSGGNHLTREELIVELQHIGIKTNENRASHLLMHAETCGIICSGKIKSGKPAYTLLHDWVHKTAAIKKEEAAAMLANRYFMSHGPATLLDFAWWSRLTLGECKTALEMIKPNLSSAVVEGNTYWYNASAPYMPNGQDAVLLLPAYDEWIISYKERSPTLQAKHFSKAVSNNGMFYPVILMNGEVIGTWKLTPKKGQHVVTTRFFNLPGDEVQEMLTHAAKPLGDFSGKHIKIESSFSTY